MAFKDKSIAMQSLVRAAAPYGKNLGQDQVACALCNKPALTFKDELSKKEFGISGMCQDCQDAFFVEE